MVNATDVIVSGCSAGGLATYLHCDHWAAAIGAATAANAAGAAKVPCISAHPISSRLIPSHLVPSHPMRHVAGRMHARLGLLFGRGPLAALRLEDARALRRQPMTGRVAASLLPRCCRAAASLLPHCCRVAASLLPRCWLPRCRFCRGLDPIYYRRNVYAFQQPSAAGLNAQCVAAHTASGDPEKCIFAQWTSQHIATPTFPLQVRAGSPQPRSPSPSPLHRCRPTLAYPSPSECVRLVANQQRGGRR
jgi:hypothetical protein